jgi:DNA-binding IclR family transcriptional regulator
MAITPAPALEKGLKILEIIAKEEQVSFNELQGLTGYNVSSLNRYLHTLRHCDYIQKNSNNKYMIGLKFYSLAEKNSWWQALIEVTQKYIIQLSNKFQISLLLIGYTNEQYIVLTKQAHSNNITMMKIGTCKYYDHDIAWALPYIDHLDSIEKENLFSSYIDNNIITEKDMKTIKADYKEKGFVYDDGYRNKNILRIGVPIYAGDNKPIALLAAGTFKVHLENREDEVIKAMKEVSINISKSVFTLG